MMEGWNDGIMGGKGKLIFIEKFPNRPNIPKFHYSNIPTGA
jgi:hypothetical protein